mgnify:CR=1 FL=1
MSTHSPRITIRVDVDAQILQLSQRDAHLLVDALNNSSASLHPRLQKAAERYTYKPSLPSPNI